MTNYVSISGVNLNTFKSFPTGELSSGSFDGIEYIDRIEIEFKDIQYETDGTNSVRQSGLNNANVNSLVEDFKNRGWLVGQPLPCVVANFDSDNPLHKWKLVQGHHRLEAMTKIGLSKFIFNVIRVNKTADFSKDTVLEMYSLKSNVTHLTQTPATKDDVMKALSRALNRGDFGSKGNEDHDLMKDYISGNKNWISFTKSESTISEIINKALITQDRLGFKIYTVAEYKRLGKNSVDPITQKLGKGNWTLVNSDNPTRTYGFLSAEFAETNMKQKLVVLIDNFNIKDEDELEKARLNVVKGLESCYNNMVKAHTTNVSDKNIRPHSHIYEVAYFVAQTKEEIESGRLHIPGSEILKKTLKKVKPTSVQIDVNTGKKVKLTKLDRVLGID